MYYKPRAAFVYQLTPAEMQQYNYDILCDGATYNIKLINKEDVIMVEKLHLYLSELEAKRVEVLTSDDSEAINAEIAEATDAILKKYAVAKETTLAKIDSDIDCVMGIIARENAIIAEAVDTVTE